MAILSGGGVKLSSVASAVHPYPTLGEINKRVVGNVFSRELYSDTVKKGLKFFFQLKGLSNGLRRTGQRRCWAAGAKRIAPVELPKRYVLMATAGAFVPTVFLFCSFLLCGVVEGANRCIWGPYITPLRIIEIVRSCGFREVALSIGLMVIHSFVPFAAEMVAIAIGMVYVCLAGSWSHGSLRCWVPFCPSLLWHKTSE